MNEGLSLRASLKSGIARIIRPLFGENAKSRLLGRSRPSLGTEAEIKDYKSGAWTSEQKARKYWETVEHRFFDNVTVQLFIQNVKAGSYVLDVGAGTGRLSFSLADHGCRVVSCDISKQMLGFIEANKQQRDITILESPGDRIPLQDSSFDAVVSMDFMLHFPAWQELLQEQVRLCKKGGVILFNFLSAENTDFLRANRTNSESITNYFASGYASFATVAQMHEVAERLGLSLEGVYPYNFFTRNSIFGCSLTEPEVRRFNEQFDKAIQNEHVMAFVRMFEEQVVRHLPTSLSVTNIVKLRKR